MLQAQDSGWYKKGWTLDIKNHSWTENTENEVDFIVQTLELTGKERILDLACGYGRHALSFARRGYAVVGVDLSEDYVQDARAEARKASLTAEFIRADIRDIQFRNEFDVVLNLADGAIGYLEDDIENLKIFDKISEALRPGGKHFMGVCNAEFAEQNCPRREWEIGEKALALALLKWDGETRRMIYAGWDVPYGQPAKKPEFREGGPCRLYTKAELREILAQRQMKIRATFSDFTGKEDSRKELALLVYSQKA